MIKLLFFGDVVGRSGRQVLLDTLPELKNEYEPDAIIINAENAARGFGLTGKICRSFYESGVDVITSGNHIWDNKDIFPHINDDPRLVRPANFPDTLPGRGATVIETPKGHKILVMNFMGQLFMSPQLNSPFILADKMLERYRLGQNVHAILVDVHAETSSEKNGMAHYLDGRVSCVVGSHTHVPTADERILPKGTAYQTDAGMCGDYNSIIGMDKTVPLERFVRKNSQGRLETAQGPGTACGLLVCVDPVTGLATKVQRVLAGHPL